jgi:LmbE family N-acetylglucosaminyl deacetylase
MRTIDVGGGPLRVLAVGAHPDDIEIGCGATILRLADEGRIAAVRWVVMTGDAPRAEEARVGAVAFAGDRHVEVDIHGFRDGYLPWEPAGLKETVEALKPFEPDLILTHRRDDMHQDHALLADLVGQVFRDHLVLGYEIPKYDGDLGRSNLYVGLTDEQLVGKVDRLLSAHRSQTGRHWFDQTVFRGLARIRGLESRVPSGLAEAFDARKLVL